jgi:hypothetical protein
LCHDLHCTDVCHHNAITQYADAISQACLSAAESSIPYTRKCCTDRRVPGWTEKVEPFCEKSILGINCGLIVGGRVLSLLLIA